MADDWAQFETKPKDEWAQYENKAPAMPKPTPKMSAVNIYSGKQVAPPKGATDMPSGSANLLTGTPSYEYPAGKTPEPQPSGFQKEHPHLYGLLKEMAIAGSVPIAPELSAGPILEKSGAQLIGGKILQAIKKRFGPDLTKVPKETQQDIAFALFKENHGAVPASAVEKVQAIKEMRAALRESRPAAAAKPAPQPKALAPSTGRTTSPLNTPPEPPRAAPGNAPTTGKSYYQAPKSTLDPGAKASPSGKLSGPAESAPKKSPGLGGEEQDEINKGRAMRDWAAKKAEPKAEASPSGTLTGPGEKPIKYESVKRTDSGAVLRRENFKQGLAKDHPGMTREQFLKLGAKEKNELIRKYNPQSQNRPYIENSKVFEEFADHVWPQP